MERLNVPKAYQACAIAWFAFGYMMVVQGALGRHQADVCRLSSGHQ
jgi:hypothetical protein